MHRASLLAGVLFVYCSSQALPGVGCGSEGSTSCQNFYPPVAGQSNAAWLQSLRTYTTGLRDSLAPTVGGNFEAYDNEGLKWAQSSFIQPQVQIHDRFLFDRETGKWTVDKYLADLRNRYGGIDAVLIWQGYTNIGCDDRNQYDLLRSLPGGSSPISDNFDGLKSLVADFHSAGIKVFLPYFLWDLGTRDEGQQPSDALVNVAVEVEADGLNGDTCDGFEAAWYEGSNTKGRALAVEAQSMGSERYNDVEGWQNVTTNVMSWGERWPYSSTILAPDIGPLVSTYKMIEPRHMVQIVDRWAENRTNSLHHAFFNAVGYETWENIWNQVVVRLPE